MTGVQTCALPISGNVIKYVATCTKGEQSAGERFNKIITELMNRLAQKGIYHVFVFTKPMYAKSFGYLGFKELARAEQGVLLEKGRPNITDFLSSLTEKKIGARWCEKNRGSGHEC